MFAKCTGLIESSTSVSMRSGSTTFRDLRFFVGDVEGGGGVEESPSLVDDWPPNLSVACLECTVRVGAMPIVRRVLERMDDTDCGGSSEKKTVRRSDLDERRNQERESRDCHSNAASRDAQRH